MTIDIPLSQEAEKRLRERAEAMGLSVRACAKQLLENVLIEPSIDEILAPVRGDLRGVTDEDFMELGGKELGALRQESRPTEGREG